MKYELRKKSKERDEEVFEPNPSHISIKEWPEGERPREKLIANGASLLTEAELLAILIRTGRRGLSAVDLVRRMLAERSLEEVAQLNVSQFQKYGIGKAKAATILAAMELAGRLHSRRGTGATARPVFLSPDDVAKFYIPKFKSLQHEEFWVVLLTAAKQLIRDVKITQGILTSSPVHPRECFMPAVTEKAASVIFIHNHPSGNPEPSREDILVTKQLVESGKILGIPVDDHLILAGNSFTSLLDRGVM